MVRSEHHSSARHRASQRRRRRARPRVVGASTVRPTPCKGRCTVLATPETLQQTIETGLRQPGRNLTEHPVLARLDRGELSRAQVQGLLTQMYVHVREVTRWIAASFAACPYPEIREMIFENLLEEQMGHYSHTAGHAELLARCAMAAGVARETLDAARPLPGTAALIDWCELMATRRHW